MTEIAGATCIANVRKKTRRSVAAAAAAAAAVDAPATSLVATTFDDLHPGILNVIAQHTDTEQEVEALRSTCKRAWKELSGTSFIVECVLRKQHSNQARWNKLSILAARSSTSKFPRSLMTTKAAAREGGRSPIDKLLSELLRISACSGLVCHADASRNIVDFVLMCAKKWMHESLAVVLDIVVDHMQRETRIHIKSLAVLWFCRCRTKSGAGNDTRGMITAKIAIGSFEKECSNGDPHENEEAQYRLKETLDAALIDVVEISISLGIDTSNVLDYMIGKGADVASSPALNLACCSENDAVFSVALKLLEKGAHVSFTAVVRACERSHMKLAKLLTRYGAFVLYEHRRTELVRYTARCPFPNVEKKKAMLRWLITSDRDPRESPEVRASIRRLADVALIEICWCGKDTSVGIVEMLVEKLGANVNANDEAPLRNAFGISHSGAERRVVNSAVVDYLMRRGSRLLIRCVLTDNHRRNVFYAACGHDANIAVVRRLLCEWGVDAYETAHTKSLCLIRVCNRHSTSSSREMQRLLLDKGADVHVNGEFPLKNACRKGDLEQVRLFLDYGADPEANHGDALFLASTHHNSQIRMELVSFLMTRGAFKDYKIAARCFNGALNKMTQEMRDPVTSTPQQQTKRVSSAKRVTRMLATRMVVLLP